MEEDYLDPCLAGDSYQQDVDYVAANMKAVIALPGCGIGYCADPSVIDDMHTTFPDLEWVGVIVSWFISDPNIEKATIKPGVEKTVEESSCEYKIGGYNRSNAHQISRLDIEDPSTVRYGETIQDSVLEKFLDKLKESGFKVALYPFLLVDNENKDWRGKISGSAKDVENFYENQYKPFIRHYANFLYKKVDMFYLGSELEGLTSIRSEDGVFPFVDCLINLLTLARGILGQGVKITYAANWTEYHSCNGGYRPLDKFWMDENTDVVAIDYYMPLTDSDKTVSYEEIMRGFSSGEGYDYYVDGETRGRLDPCNRWKDLEYWSGEKHYAWDSEVSRSYTTEWEPNAKKIIFSEFGFRSISLTTNNPGSHGSETPKHSSGEVDFPIQMKATRAMLEHIKETSYVPIGFCYGYDTRGKNWSRESADGGEWEKGHWIDGKI